MESREHLMALGMPWALAQRVGWRDYTATPVSALTPAFIGEVVRDSTNGDFYVAYGTASSQWSLMSMGGVTPAELDVLDGVSAGTVTASKALVVGTTKNLDELKITNLKIPLATHDSLFALPGYGYSVVRGDSGDSGNYSVANPVAGQFLSIFCKAGDSDSTAIVTFGDSDDSVTINGTNRVATFNAAGDVLELYAETTLRWLILNNQGSVAIS